MEKPTESTAPVVDNEWRVVLSCELQTLCCLRRIPSYTLFPWACSPFPRAHANLSMSWRNIYRNRALGGSAGAAASCNRTRVITHSASAYSDLVSE